MESQKDKCEALLRQKDGIIAMLCPKEEIKKAEKKFTSDHKKQNENIAILSGKVENQIKQMKNAYKQELRFIDEVILEERKLIIEMNRRKWEDLYKRREVEEKHQIKKKFEQQEEFIREKDDFRKAHQEQFRETKIKLEREVEALERDFEMIKTATIMNEEKLDYNFQILLKSEDENLILKSQHKKRINKLQDLANSLRKKNQEYNEHTRVERLTKEVQKQKFQQIWELSVSNAER